MMNKTAGHMLNDEDMSGVNGGVKSDNEKDLVRVKCRNCGAIFMVPRGTNPVICGDCGNDCTADSKDPAGTVAGKDKNTGTVNSRAV